MKAHRVACLLLVVGAGAAGCKENETTPSGTEIITWDASKSTRPSVVAAKELGARAIKDVKISARPDLKGPLTIKLHLETAPIQIVEDGKTARNTAPVLIRATVDANTDWTLRGRCHDGPHYRLPAAAGGGFVTPEEMVLSCVVVMHHKDAVTDLTYSLNLELAGDGAINPVMTGGTASVE